MSPDTELARPAVHSPAPTSEPGRPKALRWEEKLTVCVAVVVITALHAATLLRYPPVFVDEANLASQSWMILQTGRISGALGTVTFENFPGSWTFFPVIGYRIQALAMLFGGPSLLALRIVSLLCGYALLAAVWVIGDRLINRRGAWLAAILTALSAPFFDSAHVARQDIMVAALGFGAIALYLAEPSPGLTVRSVLSGLALGAAFEIHVNGMIYGPAIVALFWLDYGLATLRKGKFLGFAAGTIAGLTFYAVYHFALYPGAFFAVGTLAFGATKLPPLVTFQPRILLFSLAQTVAVSLTIDFLRVGLIPFAVILLRGARTRESTKLLAVSFAVFLDFVCVAPYRPWFYFILIAPVGDLLVASLLVRLLSPERIRSRQTAVALGVLLCSVLFALKAVVPLGPNPNPIGEYNVVVSQIQQTVPAKGSLVMGSGLFWFGDPNAQYLNAIELNYYRRFTGDASLEDAFRYFHPDYFIADKYIDLATTDDTSGLEPAGLLMAMSRKALLQVLARHGRLVREMYTLNYGEVRIYQMDWTAR